MIGDLFQNRYRIASSRALWHNYNEEMYFVTICTKERVHYFGEISHGDSNVAEPIMNLTIIGQYANMQFNNVTIHYPYADIPLWVVMPNHIHAVVRIEGNEIPYERRNLEQEGVVKNVETGRAPSLRKIDDMKGWLSVVVGGLKSSISKFAHDNTIPFAWQPRFHDHIIRNIDEMNRIAEYIEHNVAKWSYDEFYG